MEILLIIGFSQAFILCGLILMKKESQLHDRFLAILFFIHGLTLFLGYMEIYNRANGYPYPLFHQFIRPSHFIAWSIVVVLY
jgi:hypothetical protein